MLSRSRLVLISGTNSTFFLLVNITLYCPCKSYNSDNGKCMLHIWIRYFFVHLPLPFSFCIPHLLVYPSLSLSFCNAYNIKTFSELNYFWEQEVGFLSSLYVWHHFPGKVKGKKKNYKRISLSLLLLSIKLSCQLYFSQTMHITEEHSETLGTGPVSWSQRKGQ